IVQPLGRNIDSSNPMVDARLEDGSRVNAIIPPLSVKGPILTIRKFKEDMLSIDDLLRTGTLTPYMARFLEAAVKAKLNIIISGGTGTGKTTLLNVLSSFIEEDERIITIEDAAELKLGQPHVVSLETRNDNIEGEGEVTVRDLLRNSLRMRPDRIIVGEVRGEEALDMLQAMNTGHEGSLTTLHANSAYDSLSRLETMLLLSSNNLPLDAIRQYIADAIDIIVHIDRLSDGKRRITNISEVIGIEDDIIKLEQIFAFNQTGITETNSVMGEFVLNNYIPKVYNKIRIKGINTISDIFIEKGD
ncbi:MAG: ATPase, T2SS/T4P/T4SS family, partial [Bacilli bacterium]